MSFHVGLDLGQSADYTALAVVEEAAGELRMRHLERYPLRTSYIEIADGVRNLITKIRWIGQGMPELVIDRTGVGQGVADLLRERGLSFKSVTITGGGKVTREEGAGGGWKVPKRDLVAALEVPFHAQQLKVAAGLTLWPTLREELLNFRRKIDLRTAHDSYEHWRESDHDDLVLAAALACWWATRTAKARNAPVGVGGRALGGSYWSGAGDSSLGPFGSSPFGSGGADWLPPGATEAWPS